MFVVMISGLTRVKYLKGALLGWVGHVNLPGPYSAWLCPYLEIFDQAEKGCKRQTPWFICSGPNVINFFSVRNLRIFAIN
jgi:hypothetical protein